MKVSSRPRMPKITVPKAPRPKSIKAPAMPKIKGMVNPFKIFK